MNRLFGGLGSGPNVADLPLSEIVPDPNQPRKHFDADSIKELAETIKEQGLIQPIIVRTNPDGGGYIIIAGERRWRAAQKAGLEKINAIVRDDLEPETAALIENIQRVNLKPLEEAEAIQHLIEEKGISQGDVGALIGKSRITVNQLLKLRTLPEEVKAESIALDTPKTILVELSKLNDEKTITRLWRRSKSEALSVAQIRAAKTKKTQPADDSEPPSPTGRAFERAFNALAILKVADLTDDDRGRLMDLRAAIDALLAPTGDAD